MYHYVPLCTTMYHYVPLCTTFLQRALMVCMCICTQLQRTGLSERWAYTSLQITPCNFGAEWGGGGGGGDGVYSRVGIYSEFYTVFPAEIRANRRICTLGGVMGPPKGVPRSGGSGGPPPQWGVRGASPAKFCKFRLQILNSGHLPRP